MVTVIANSQPGISESIGLVPEQEASSIPCFLCGMCCTRYRVNLSRVEARRICDGLGLNWYIFLGNYVEPSLAGADNFYLRQQDGACIFLKKRGGEPYRTVCLVHACKPATCRVWNASLYNKECQEGLKNYWGLAVTSEGQLQGPDEKIQRFQAFLTSLKTNGGACELSLGKRSRFLQK